MVEVGKWLAEQLRLEFTQMVDISNSLHLYGSDFQQLERHFDIIAKREAEAEVKKEKIMKVEVSKDKGQDGW